MTMVKRATRVAASLGLGAALIAGWAGMPVSAARDDAPAGSGSDRDLARNALVGLPLAFEENRGQTDASVRFLARGARHAFFLTADRAMLSFVEPSAAPDPRQPPDAAGVALALRFLHANQTPAVEGTTRVPGEFNYLRGSDPSGWLTGVPRFDGVVYRDLWPGIDMTLYDRAGTLKYEFRVRPGARPADIRLAYAGAERVTLDRDGRLRLDTALGVLHDAAPIAWQDVDGVRVAVASRYDVGGARHGETPFGFALGSNYRADRELVIDPGLAYSTLLGGTSHEIGAGIAVNSAGNAFVVGTTQSPGFPTTAGAFRRTGAGSTISDVFVTKLNAAGSALVYSTFLGGSNFDFGRRIAIDAAGNAYVTGQTKSSNFPTTGNAFDRTFNIPANCPRCGIDNYDGFVTKLNANGSALVYSTFLGGTDIDSPRGIAVDGSGNAYVTGETVSRDFPTTAAAFNRTHRGEYDVFVAKLNATGSALAYSTFLGGTLSDNGERVQVDGSGNAYVAGFTRSTDFPTTAGAFDRTANGEFDVFVTKLNAAGSALVYSTFLGGSGFDQAGGLFVDAGGSAYVAGGAGSVDFPTTAGAYDTTPDGGDAFVTRLNAAGSALIFSTVIGGTGGEGASGVGVDSSGNVWIAGGTGSSDFPVTPDASDSSFNGSADAFVAELSPTGAALLFASYLGGTNSENANDLALDPAGNAYLTGHTYSIDFPTTAGAFQTLFRGDPSIFWGDAFIAKYSATGGSTPPNPPAVPGAPALLEPANASTPPQPITFQWNIASSATSYQIQIDDSSGFTAPLIRNESGITDIRYATTGLASTTHFWRVRGVNVAGVAGAWSAVRSFAPQSAPPPAGLSTMDTNPSTVAGGNSSFGTVVLSTGAPFGGAVIGLSSSNPGVASVPATTTAPANSFTASFTIATSPVASTTTVTITASYNGDTRTANITVTPPSAPASLLSVLVSPSTVQGMVTTFGIVTLASPAPADGVFVTLSSSNPVVASPPPNIVVFPNATTQTFTVSTTAVSVSTAVTISATVGSTTRTTPLTVTPIEQSPPPPPPTGQNATLTVSVTGRSGERVTSSPTGISVATGSTGSATFASGASITLTASNGRDAIWSGACSSSGTKRRTCTFTLSVNATVTASIQ